MNLNELTDKVRTIALDKQGALSAKIKFQFEEGNIFLDDTKSPSVVTNEDSYADCTIKLSLKNFEKLLNGDLNAMGAFMMGKLKVDGDMSVAMKLSGLF